MEVGDSVSEIVSLFAHVTNPLPHSSSYFHQYRNVKYSSRPRPSDLLISINARKDLSPRNNDLIDAITIVLDLIRSCARLALSVTVASNMGGALWRRREVKFVGYYFFIANNGLQLLKKMRFHLQAVRERYALGVGQDEAGLSCAAFKILEGSFGKFHFVALLDDDDDCFWWQFDFAGFCGCGDGNDARTIRRRVGTQELPTLCTSPILIITYK